MDSTLFLEESQPGDAWVKICCDGYPNYRIKGLHLPTIAAAAPLLALAFEEKGGRSLYTFANNSSPAGVISLLRFCYLGDYMLCPAHADDESCSLRIHLEVFRLSDIFDLPALQRQVMRRINLDIEKFDTMTRPLIDLVDGIRFLYLELRHSGNLRTTIAHYCVRNFHHHNLSQNMEFLQTVRESPLFHNDIQCANYIDEFRAQGARDIMNLQTCSNMAHDTFEAHKLPFADFLCSLHLHSQPAAKSEEGPQEPPKYYTPEGLAVEMPRNPRPLLTVTSDMIADDKKSQPLQPLATAQREFPFAQWHREMLPLRQREDSLALHQTGQEARWESLNYHPQRHWSFDKSSEFIPMRSQGPSADQQRLPIRNQTHSQFPVPIPAATTVGYASASTSDDDVAVKTPPTDSSDSEWSLVGDDATKSLLPAKRASTSTPTPPPSRPPPLQRNPAIRRRDNPLAQPSRPHLLRLEDMNRPNSISSPRPVPARAAFHSIMTRPTTTTHDSPTINAPATPADTIEPDAHDLTLQSLLDSDSSSSDSEWSLVQTPPETP